MSIDVNQLTEVNKASGIGVFDVLMRAMGEHIVGEYTNNRLKGPEYATVYLGSLQATLEQSMAFLMGRDKLNLELEILAIEKDKALAEKQLVEAQVQKLQVEVEIAELEKARVSADTLRIGAQTQLLQQQKENAEKEHEVLEAQKCKLQAEFDLIMTQIPKVEAEAGLLQQKKVTEQAQTNSAGVDANSVIGKQTLLYSRQADGFLRDAEQKVAKLMADTWSVRRTTDETGTVANNTNKLDDITIGRVMEKVLEGVNA